MDITVLTAVAVGLIVLIVAVSLFSRRSGGSKPDAPDEEPAPRVQPVRRAAGVRNAGRRMRGAGNAAGEVVVDEARDVDDEQPEAEEKAEGKLGAKKRAKLEAKADKRREREAAEREREERKKREQLQLEESERLREKERLEEEQREEEARKAREEKERREHEEYLKMREAFSVEEEGFLEKDREQENMLRDFVARVKSQKVVILEDLAAHFGIRTASVVERIRQLQEDGTLTGVIDDRGKFIFISQEELEEVAKFVRVRGRVSIAELAENSNRLIDLNPGSGDKIIEAN